VRLPQKYSRNSVASAALFDRPGPYKAFVNERNAILEALVRKFPDDIQGNRRYMIDTDAGKDELRQRYKSRFDAAPDNALSMYLLRWLRLPQQRSAMAS
jgi:hypothetical protein